MPDEQEAADRLRTRVPRECARTRRGTRSSPGARPGRRDRGLLHEAPGGPRCRRPQGGASGGRPDAANAAARRRSRARQSAVFTSYHVNKRGMTLDVSARRAAAPRSAGPIRDVVRAFADAAQSGRRIRPGRGRLCEWAEHRRRSWPPSLRSGSRAPGATCASRPSSRSRWAEGCTSPVSARVLPLAAPGQLAWDEAGIHAAVGISAALVGPRSGGRPDARLRGSRRVGRKDFLLERFERRAARRIGGGRWRSASRRLGCGSAARAPRALAAHQRHHWEVFLTMLDQPEELSDPSFADPCSAGRSSTFWRGDRASLMLTGAGRPIREGSGGRASLCAPYNTPDDFVRDIQPLARDTLRPVDARLRR